MQQGVAHKFVGRVDELVGLRELLLDRPAEKGVVVVGPPGIGKTSLVTLFAHTYKQEFSGGTEFVSAYANPLRALPDRFLRTHRQGLVIIDEADAADRAELGAYVRLFEDRPTLSLLMTARNRLDDVPGLAYLALGALTATDIINLGVDFDLTPDILDSLVRQSGGNPLAVNLLARYAHEGNLGEVVKALGAKALPTVLGPNGKALAASDGALERVEIAASGIGDALIEALAARPDLMYTISPRQFEELVAELYDREGYEVELTPVSNDGGVDIYAVQRTAFGSFLTVIDCKRYRKDRPIEVDLVRQLYGTVEAQDASVGVLATTSHFTRGAKAFQRDRKFRLGLQDFLDLHEMLRRQTDL
jgi:restriction system protein